MGDGMEAKRREEKGVCIYFSPFFGAHHACGFEKEQVREEVLFVL